MKFSLISRFAQSSAPANVRSQAVPANSRVRAALLGLVALLGASAWSNPVQAQAPQTVRTMQGDAESLCLTVENPELKRVEVRVVQLSNNNCLSNEVNYKPSYGTKLKFGGLPAGEYAVMLRVGQERYRYVVQVQAQRPTISVRGLDNQAIEKAVASTTR